MGEVNAAAALISGLQENHPDLPVCVTAFTPTGSQRILDLFGDSVDHVLSPFDLPGSVRRFFDRVRPRLLLIMETEIWPNLYHEAARRGVPVMVANARISDRSLNGYRRFHRLTRSALEKTAHIAAQSEQDADRLCLIGAPAERLSVTGNIKFDLPLPANLAREGEAIRSAWGSQRTVLVAGSTHADDEAALVEAFKALLERWPQALLVLVPRHPERFVRAAGAARDAGFRVALHSEGLDSAADAQCYVIDAMGELLRYYAAGDVAFVGGSIARIGSHNPLEPAALARPVVLGPHTFNFADITRQLLEADAAIQVEDVNGLQTALEALFTDAALRERTGQAGEALVHSGRGAVDRTLALVERVITATAG
jgi:3-deoxy-D-manno-octulosonic-acid transferase